MPYFIIETSYRLPVYRRKPFEAPTLEDACRAAIEDEDWSDQQQDHESAGDTYVSGIWLGQTAYHGQALPAPCHFGDMIIQRKADHFDALAATLRILMDVARPRDSLQRQLRTLAPSCKSDHRQDRRHS